MYYSHKEKKFADFDRDQLLYQMKSNEGPRIAIADVNADNGANLFIGRARIHRARCTSYSLGESSGA